MNMSESSGCTAIENSRDQIDVSIPTVAESRWQIRSPHASPQEPRPEYPVSIPSQPSIVAERGVRECPAGEIPQTMA